MNLSNNIQTVKAMKTNDYINLWKTAHEKLSRKDILSKEEINILQKKKSRDVNQALKKDFWFDIVFKAIIAGVYFYTISLYTGNVAVVLFSSAMIAVMAGSALYLYNQTKKLKATRQVDAELYRVLKHKLTYFKTGYRKAVQLLSLSSPLTVMAAILIYFHSKYNGFRPMEMEDWLVFGTIVLISYMLSFTVLSIRHRQYIRELEAYMGEIDESTLESIRSNEKRSKRFQMILILLILLGVVAGMAVYFLVK